MGVEGVCTGCVRGGSIEYTKMHRNIIGVYGKCFRTVPRPSSSLVPRPVDIILYAAVARAIYIYTRFLANTSKFTPQRRKHESVC